MRLQFVRNVGAVLFAFFLTVTLEARAQPEIAGMIALERVGGGASGGVLEARLNGTALGVLYETDRIEHPLEPGSYRLEVRLLLSEGGGKSLGLSRCRCLWMSQQAAVGRFP